MKKRTWVLASAVAVLALAAGVASAQSAWSSKINYVTFSGSVALPGMVLPGGSYTFELHPPGAGLGVVRVSTRDGRRVLFNGLTHAVIRPAGMPTEDVITLGEATPGEAPPIQVWFPRGDMVGHRFIYR